MTSPRISVVSLTTACWMGFATMKCWIMRTTHLMRKTETTTPNCLHKWKHFKSLWLRSSLRWHTRQSMSESKLWSSRLEEIKMWARMSKKFNSKNCKAKWTPCANKASNKSSRNWQHLCRVKKWHCSRNLGHWGNQGNTTIKFKSWWRARALSDAYLLIITIKWLTRL